MDPEFREDAPQPPKREEKPAETPPQPKETQRSRLSVLMNALLGMGLGENLLRTGTTVLSLILVAAAIGLLQMYNRQTPLQLGAKLAFAAAGPTATAYVDPNLLPPPVDTSISGVARQADSHTNVPSRPREDVIQYTIADGDTVFGIAEKFGLKPETILWGNYNTLADNPEMLTSGEKLNILPVDGVYYQWLGGTSFADWAKFFGVTPADILEYPGNHIDLNTVGDYNNPNIAAGAWLIIPGGTRQMISWSAPLGLTRDNPAIASEMGPGACGPVNDGAVGYGTFIWPSAKHYLSGYDYRPPIHYGIDIAGSLGEGVFAADAGVVVYAGWNKYGFGNMVMIDHGTGFQTLYGHLSEIYVSCGQSVGQGDAIGAIGSTGRSSGPHLHFEIRTSTYFVNPWDYLPPP